MKKTLIYLNETLLAPKGGPYAVGYYVYNELKKRNVHNIHFLAGSSEPLNRKKRLRIVQKWGAIINRIRRYYRAIKKGDKRTVNFNEYGIVHFHQTREMFEVRKSLEKYSGTVILTSHSPVPFSKEIYDEQLSSFEKFFFKSLYSRLIEMDEYAFSRADIILFPCEEAEEPYINNWPDFELIKRNKIAQFKYIPTGIPQCIPKREKSEVRRELLIPEGAFCVSYVGRHNIVKGYDSLKRIGEKLLKDDSNWFVIAGNQAPLTGIEHPRWIEIGWTTDAHSYINCSDVFVLPNKETYFDIVMLEVLSLGKIVVASNTGGNKYFQKLAPNGVFLYNNEDEAVSILNKIKSMTCEERVHLGLLNKTMYEKNFTDTIFVSKYLDFLETL